MMIKNRSVRTSDDHHHSSATVYAVCILMELMLSIHHPSEVRTLMMMIMTLSPLCQSRALIGCRASRGLLESLQSARIHITWYMSRDNSAVAEKDPSSICADYGGDHHHPSSTRPWGLVLNDGDHPPEWCAHCSFQADDDDQNHEHTTFFTLMVIITISVLRA